MGARSAIQRDERVAFLFNTEKNGLSSDDFVHVHALVNIPFIPGFEPLNLAQSVLLLAYEWNAVGAQAVNPSTSNPKAVSAQAMKLPTSTLRAVGAQAVNGSTKPK